MPYTPTQPYTKANPYQQRQSLPDFFLKIDEVNFLLIDGMNRLIIQPARSGQPFTKRNVYTPINPYVLQ